MSYEDEDDRTCLSIHDQVEQLSDCHLGSKEENFPIDHDKTLVDTSSSSDSDTDYEDDGSSSPPYQIVSSEEDDLSSERNFFSYESNFSCERSVAEGENIVQKPLNSYIFALKEEYHIKNALERGAFFERFLERAVGRFASEALDDVGLCGEFVAILTEDELQKLSGMEEVAKVNKVQPRMVMSMLRQKAKGFHL